MVQQAIGLGGRAAIACLVNFLVDTDVATVILLIVRKFRFCLSRCRRLIRESRLTRGSSRGRSWCTFSAPSRQADGIDCGEETFRHICHDDSDHEDKVRDWISVLGNANEEEGHAEEDNHGRDDEHEALNFLVGRRLHVLRLGRDLGDASMTVRSPMFTTTPVQFPDRAGVSEEEKVLGLEQVLVRAFEALRERWSGSPVRAACSTFMSSGAFITRTSAGILFPAGSLMICLGERPWIQSLSTRLRAGQSPWAEAYQQSLP